MTERLRSIGAALLFLVGTLAITLLFAATVSRVPTGDIPRLTLILAVSGVAAGSCGMLLTRPALLRRFGGVRSQIVVGVGLVGNLLLRVVAVAGAVAMFISLHDLSILLTMLLFASLLAFGPACAGCRRWRDASSGSGRGRRGSPAASSRRRSPSRAMTSSPGWPGTSTAWS